MSKRLQRLGMELGVIRGELTLKIAGGLYELSAMEEGLAFHGIGGSEERDDEADA